jgi:hypothetical protein
MDLPQWILQFRLRDFDVTLATMRQVLRIRPGFNHPHIYIAASLGYLGRMDEAREALNRARAGYRDGLHPMEGPRPAWVRPEDFAFRQAGLRLAKGEQE